MRRNIGKELVVALTAAFSLLFAGLFALLLSRSTQNPPIPPSPTDQSEIEFVATEPSPAATLTSESFATVEPTSTLQVTLPATVVDTGASSTPTAQMKATAATPSPSAAPGGNAHNHSASASNADSRNP